MLRSQVLLVSLTVKEPHGVLITVKSRKKTFPTAQSNKCNKRDRKWLWAKLLLLKTRMNDPISLIRTKHFSIQLFYLFCLLKSLNCKHDKMCTLLCSTDSWRMKPLVHFRVVYHFSETFSLCSYMLWAANCNAVQSAHFRSQLAPTARYTVQHHHHWCQSSQVGTFRCEGHKLLWYAVQVLVCKKWPLVSYPDREKTWKLCSD